MSTGLIALLDDIAALAKVAATSLDDIAAQTIKVGTKSAGVVIDDAAVTPRYVVGFDPSRELPIVAKIAWGSIKNKLLFLLPAALVLSLVAPWLITPLLMLGGGYLCYEGAEKILETLFPHQAHQHEEKIGVPVGDPKQLEEERIAGAIRTDFILSAEIMAISLAGVPDASFGTQAAVLALVGIGITIVVYGSVALIVKADDVGVLMGSTTSTSLVGKVSRVIGRGLVVGMPYFLKLLAIVGTIAMLWVGGSIVMHGLAEFGFHLPEHLVHELGKLAPSGDSTLAAFVQWMFGAIGAGIFGLIVGAILIPVVQFVVAPIWNKFQPAESS